MARKESSYGSFYRMMKVAKQVNSTVFAVGISAWRILPCALIWSVDSSYVDCYSVIRCYCKGVFVCIFRVWNNSMRQINFMWICTARTDTMKFCCTASLYVPHVIYVLCVQRKQSTADFYCVNECCEKVVPRARLPCKLLLWEINFTCGHRCDGSVKPLTMYKILIMEKSITRK